MVCTIASRTMLCLVVCVTGEIRSHLSVCAIMSDDVWIVSPQLHLICARNNDGDKMLSLILLCQSDVDDGLYNRVANHVVSCGVCNGGHLITFECVCDHV